MKRTLLLLVVLCLAWPVTVATTSLLGKPHPADLAVIFGTAVTDSGTPKPALRDRLQTGLSLWQDGTVKRLMVSGAIETRNHQNEATIMAHWLEARGVPPGAIIIDDAGNNSWKTALNVAKLKPESAIVVTQWFHIMRARWALQHAGTKTVSGAYPARFRLPELWYLIRESVALPVYALTKHPPQ